MCLRILPVVECETAVRHAQAHAAACEPLIARHDCSAGGRALGQRPARAHAGTRRAPYCFWQIFPGIIHILFMMHAGRGRWSHTRTLLSLHRAVSAPSLHADRAQSNSRTGGAKTRCTSQGSMLHAECSLQHLERARNARGTMPLPALPPRRLPSAAAAASQQHAMWGGSSPASRVTPSSAEDGACSITHTHPPGAAAGLPAIYV